MIGTGMHGDGLMSRPLHHCGDWRAGALAIPERKKPIGTGVIGVGQRGRKHTEAVHLANAEVSGHWIRGTIRV